jgi:hypothetical protein
MNRRSKAMMPQTKLKARMGGGNRMRKVRKFRIATLGSKGSLKKCLILMVLTSSLGGCSMQPRYANEHQSQESVSHLNYRLIRGDYKIPLELSQEEAVSLKDKATETKQGWIWVADELDDEEKLLPGQLFKVGEAR